MIKTTISWLILVVFCALPAFCQQEQKNTVDRFDLGIQLGTDIGGAIPVPFKYIPSPYNPYPKLNISLGAKAAIPVKSNWALGAEVTYKTVAIHADARVKNQRFQEKEHIQYFTGTAKMEMSFAMLEVPVYARYHFKNGRDRVLAGPYGAWIMSPSFVIDPVKGFVGMGEPDTVDAVMDDDLEDMDFGHTLDSWDMGLVVGYERKVSPRLELGLRFMCGFKDIFKRNNQYFDYKMLHMRGTVVLSYTLMSLRTPPGKKGK